MKDLFEFDGGSVVPLIGMGYSGYVYSPKMMRFGNLSAIIGTFMRKKLACFFIMGVMKYVLRTTTVNGKTYLCML
jgi:hypothetical protein